MKKFVEKGKKMITLSILAMAVMCGTALAANIDAIVPASLPITVSADGSVVTATNASIQNYGSDPLSVSSINVAGQNGWSLATKDTAATAAIGDKVIAMAFNGQWSDTNGVVNVASFDKIAAKGSLPLKYDAKAPAAKTAESEEAATATFVVKDLSAPTMAAGSSWYKSTVDRNTITKITFMDSYTPSTAADEKWFADVDNTGSITCYRTGTEIIIVGDGSGKIKANANASYMFSNPTHKSTFSKLSSFEGLNLLDTSQVTNMSYMFYYCLGLTNLDVSPFNTFNVTNMDSMFSACVSLTSLSLSNFDTSHVTSMSSMFKDCVSLTDVDVSNFETECVINMSNMFAACFDLTTLDVSHFNTSNTVNMADMFSACDSLEYIDVSHFNTSNVIDMSGMFASCDVSNLDLSHFDTSKVTSMAGMFRACSSLTSIDVSNFNTSNVTNIGGMFYSCKSITSLDLTNFDTSNVTTMGSMFSYCSGLTNLNLSNFNTANVTDMRSMFKGCKGLTSLDVSNFNTANVTTLSSMFDGCSGLPSLDLSSFDSSQVTSMSYMFYSCSGLTTIYASDTWNTDKVTSSNYMFTGCTNLKGAIAYKSNYTDKTYATIYNGYLTAKNVAVPTLAYEFSWFTNGFESIDDADSYVTSIKKIIFKNSYTPSGNQSKSWNADSKNSGAIKCYLSDNTLIVAGNGSGSIKAHPDSSDMFYESDGEFNFNSLTEIDGLELLDTSDVVYMDGMFEGCEKLTTLDLSNFDTSSVTNMNFMFEDCSNLTTIYVSDKWNTNKVSKNSRMFLRCSSLKGAISYDPTKTTATYANWTTGYLTYKAASTKTLSLNIDPNTGTVTSYDVSTSPMSTYKEMIRAVAAA